MGRKTIILREDQFNEICGTNTAYLDNDNDYAEDGTVTTKAAGAVSDSNGEKEYSKPVTGKQLGHEMAPETLWALLFRNGGHGLWGHWGSGLRARELAEGVNPDADWEEELFYKCLSYLKKTEYKDDTNLLGDTLYEVIDRLKDDDKFNSFDFKKQANIVVRETMKKIDSEYYWQEYAGQPLPRFDYLFESNSELEGNTYVMDLGDGKKKTFIHKPDNGKE